MSIYQTARRVLDARDEGIAFAAYIILDEVLMRDLPYETKQQLLRQAFIELLVDKFEFSTEDALYWADEYKLT